MNQIQYVSVLSFVHNCNSCSSHESSIVYIGPSRFDAYMSAFNAEWSQNLLEYLTKINVLTVNDNCNHNEVRKLISYIISIYKQHDTIPEELPNRLKWFNKINYDVCKLIFECSYFKLMLHLNNNDIVLDDLISNWKTIRDIKFCSDQDKIQYKVHTFDGNHYC